MSGDMDRLRAERDAAAATARRQTELARRYRERAERAEAQVEALREALYQVDYLAKCLNGGFGPKYPPKGVSSDDLLAITQRALKRRKSKPRQGLEVQER